MMTMPFTTWITNLQTDTAQVKPAALTHKERQRRQRHKLRFQPMAERIENFLATLSPEEQLKPRPITFFTANLKAKYHPRGVGNACAAEVGVALRELGWQRVRQWDRQQQGFRATWHPPQSPSNPQQDQTADPCPEALTARS